MTKKKKIFLTVLLGVLALGLIILFVEKFTTIKSCIDVFNDFNLTYYFCFTYDIDMSKHYSCVLNRELLLLFLIIILFCALIFLCILFVFEKEFLNLKYSYEEYKKEKAEKEELKKQKKKEKLEKELEKLKGEKET